MKPVKCLALILASSALACATAAMAQSPAAPAAMTPEQKLEMLAAQIDALQKQVNDLKAQVTKVTPSWKGAPQFSDANEGWSFKPRGRFHYDTGYVSIPSGFVANRNLGFNSRVRRFHLGAEGTVPGGFGYKVEVDFANAAIGFDDVVISYAPKGKPYAFKIGNHETLNGLDQMTGSNYTSFLERAQGNDAFANTRRLGFSAGLHSKDERLRLDAGLFAAHSIDNSFNNDGFIAAVRAVATPKLGKGQLHLGANVQYRDFQSNDGGTVSNSVGAPSTNQIARYRARPFQQTTDVRFVDTGNFAARHDLIIGAEFAGLFGPLYFASEAQINHVSAYRAGDIATGLDAFAGGSVVTPTGDPTFVSAYGEIGYFLTGETRGYKNGVWDRTKVLNPLSKGGSGAFELIGRIDYLDLDSNKLKGGATNNFATGVSTLAAAGTRLGRGGKQTGYLLGLTWMPQDYVRFLVNYIHTAVEGGPFAATVKPLSTLPVDQRKYSTDGVALRAQVDF